MKINSAHQKTPLRKRLDKPQTGKNIFTLYISDTGFVLKIYNKLLQINSKKTNSPLKMSKINTIFFKCANHLTAHLNRPLTKKDTRMANNIKKCSNL